MIGKCVTPEQKSSVDWMEMLVTIRTADTKSYRWRCSILKLRERVRLATGVEHSLDVAASD